MNQQSNEDFNFQQKISYIEKKLYLSALSILRNEEDAKDALQETIYIAYRKFNYLKNKKAFECWVTRILINESYKIYNKRKKYIELSLCKDDIFATYDTEDYLFFDMISKLKKHEKIILYYDFITIFQLNK